MKTVEFKWDLVSGGYDAYENGKINKGADGTYYPASEANERIKVLEDALKALLPHVNETSSIGKIIMQALESK
jgi:hypothetical protein